MYANFKTFHRDGRKKHSREGLPAYAYSRYLSRLSFGISIIYILCSHTNYYIVLVYHAYTIF